MIVYLYDDTGYFISEYICQKDPLESARNGHDIFLMPQNSTNIKPPTINKEYEYVIFEDGAWNIKQLPKSDDYKYTPSQIDNILINLCS